MEDRRLQTLDDAVRIAWLRSPKKLEKDAERALQLYEDARAGISSMSGSALEYRPEKRPRGMKYSRVEDAAERVERLDIEALDALNEQARVEMQIHRMIDGLPTSEAQTVFEYTFGMLSHGSGRDRRWRGVSKARESEIILENLRYISVPDDYAPKASEITAAEKYLAGKIPKEPAPQTGGRVKGLKHKARAKELLTYYMEYRHMAYAAYIEGTRERKYKELAMGADEDAHNLAISRVEKLCKKYKKAAGNAASRIREAVSYMTPEDRRVFLTYYVRAGEDLYRASKELGIKKTDTMLAAGRAYRAYEAAVRRMNLTIDEDTLEIRQELEAVSA